MLIAGEASGDLLGAELVQALREALAGVEAVPTSDYQPLHASLEPRFFGAGGPRMAEAGVDLEFDLTAHAVTGISDVLKNLLKFRRLLNQLYHLAIAREPDAIVCIDFSGFNRRLAHALKSYARTHSDWFHDWNPRLIQYVSPQVWASREGRAYDMARDYDLVLSIFPFERDWYAKRVPDLRVEFVGNPLLDRYGPRPPGPPTTFAAHPTPTVLLLPGSRPGELQRHLPVMLSAVEMLRRDRPGLIARMVLPDERLAAQAKAAPRPTSLEIQVGGLPEALRAADIAIASTGTVTMECAAMGVPTVALYRTSWSNYQIAKRVVKVKYLAMPNLLANDEVFPEFIQNAATAENIARAADELLRDGSRRKRTKERLFEIIESLGRPGASRRAAQTIVRLLEPDLVPVRSAA